MRTRTHAPRCDVFHATIAGFGGYNTTLAQFLVEEVFSDCTASNTLLAAVWFGANDAARPLPLGTA